MYNAVEITKNIMKAFAYLHRKIYMFIQVVLENIDNQRNSIGIEMPLANDECLPSSFFSVSQLIKFLSMMMSMAEITLSSVCIPAVMASCGNNLWVNSLPPKETLPQLVLCRTIFVSAFLIVCGRALPEARLSLETVRMYFSVQAVPLFSGINLHTGWFVESDAEASWWLLKNTC